MSKLKSLFTRRVKKVLPGVFVFKKGTVCYKEWLYRILL